MYIQNVLFALNIHEILSLARTTQNRKDRVGTKTIPVQDSVRVNGRERDQDHVCRNRFVKFIEFNFSRE